MTLEKPAGAASKLGTYELLKEQAGVGVGSAWIARALDDKSEEPKLFSVVRVHRHLLKKPDTAETCIADTRQAVGFQHPSVVGLLEVKHEGGDLFLASEHHEGELLSTLITSAGAQGLPQPVVLRVALDVLAGLAAAHALDPALCHGELGPNHVLVGADGTARVAGLGAARALVKLSPPLGAKNSDRLSYAAPERVKSMASSTATAPPLDARADVFSAAVMIWEGIAKQRLFTSKIEAALIQKVLTAPVTPLAGMAGVSVPASLDEALQRALDRDPSKRASTSELCAAIEALGEGEIATAKQVADEVERLAGKAITTRRNDVRAEIAKRAGKGPAAPAAGAKGIPVRRSTLLGMVAPVGTRTSAPPPPMDAAPASKPSAEAAPVSKPIEAAPVTKPAGEIAPAARIAALPPPPPLAAKPVIAPKPALPKPADPKRKSEPALSLPDTDLEAFEEASAKPAAAPPPPPTKRGATLAIGTPSASTLAKPSADDEPRAAKAPIVEIKLPEPTEAEVKLAAELKPGPSDVKTTADVKPGTTPRPASPSVLLEAAQGKTAHTPPAESDSPSPRSKGHAAVEKVGPGTTLGRYEILMPVARGGMASVWAAKLPGSRGFQKIFAIKTMLPDVSDDPDFEKMFLDEGRVAARIRHPNVVEIIDLGEQDDVLYLVMEWVDGENLGALIKAARALGGVPMPIILKIASQVCAGLHAAHELRDDDGNLLDLVHRDISPANVLVSTSGFVKITDFGIAKSKGRLHVTRVGGVVKGKTPYLSPEQLGQLSIDRRSDIFSFGVLLYVLSTGLHPFRGETDTKTIENIALREPVPLRAIVKDTPAEYEAIVLKALAKNPNDRYTTAADMQRALDQVAVALGQATTEEDIASFVRKALGESLGKRTLELRGALDRAENRGAPGPDAGDGAPPKSAATPPPAETAPLHDGAGAKPPTAPIKRSAVEAAAPKPPAKEAAATPKPPTAEAAPRQGSDADAALKPPAKEAGATPRSPAGAPPKPPLRPRPESATNDSKAKEAAAPPADELKDPVVAEAKPPVPESSAIDVLVALKEPSTPAPRDVDAAAEVAPVAAAAPTPAPAEEEGVPAPAPLFAVPPPPPDPPPGEETSRPVTTAAEAAAALPEPPGVPKKRKPVVQFIAVGAIALCLIIGGAALLSGGGKKGSTGPAATGVKTSTPTPTATSAPQTPSATPAETATAEPTPTVAPTTEPAPTETATTPPPKQVDTPRVTQPRGGTGKGKTKTTPPIKKDPGGKTKKSGQPYNPPTL